MHSRWERPDLTAIAFSGRFGRGVAAPIRGQFRIFANNIRFSRINKENASIGGSI